MNIGDTIQWILSSVGGLSAFFSWRISKNLNQQKHDLDKLKTKFDYILKKKNDVISELNKRISDIELWRSRLLGLDGADDIDIPRFHQLLHNYEDAYAYGRYLLSPELCGCLEDLFAILNRCYEIWQNEECPYIKPEDAFADAIFASSITDKINGAKWRLKQEIDNINPVHE